MKKKKWKVLVKVIAVSATAAAAGCKILNRMEERTPELQEGETNRGLAGEVTFYEKYVKRAIDVSVAFVGLVLTAPIVAVASVFIYKEDAGNVIFSQKRVGVNKTHFQIHKLRSMKQNTGDIPTHLLSKEAQDQMILKTGRFIRKTSIDELPQFVDILRGRMSLVGPRPALWNQFDLIAERDLYGANDVRPGLTGLAQINGRDELSIEEKSTYDGQYREALRKSSLSGFRMDLKCFLGTIRSVLTSEGVVEGGTGSKKETGRTYTENKTEEELIGRIGFSQPVEIDYEAKKKILVTGAGSYIGEAFLQYAKRYYGDNLEVSTLDMLDGSWRDKDFSAYDIVYHVAGIAHADVGNVDEATKQNYYAVNTDLAIEVCKKAKEEGVKEFIFMSSMIVYGESAPFGKRKIVDENTVPKAANFYGDSKLQADVAVRALADENFRVFVLRPPMIYGKDCKGNYKTLAKMAKVLPVFPAVKNQRSMLHIDNLCELLCQIMLIRETGQDATVLLPQNREWTQTTQLVKMIARANGKKVIDLKFLAPFVAVLGKVPGKVGSLVNKAFGNSCYAKKVSVYPGIDYQKVNLQESVLRTQREETKDVKREDAPFVSVITVSYNSEKTIRKTIESVLQQSYGCMEYLIIDGLSTDSTVKIAREYEERFLAKGVRYRIISEKDQGIYDAMNKGIGMAQGEIIGIINSDDWYERDAVEKVVESYQKTGFDYYFADIRLVKADGRSMIKHSRMDHVVTSRHWNHPTSFVTRKTYKELGVFACEGIHDDFEFYLRVRKSGRKIVIGNEVLANFMVGGVSNDKQLAKCVKRCRDRYHCYRKNQYSRWYLVECVAIEVMKFLVS